MLSHHGEIMEILGAKAATAGYSGAVTMVSSGVFVMFGVSVTQVQIAFISMIIGAIVGIGGLVANVVFKYLAHKEICRTNRLKEFK